MINTLRKTVVIPADRRLYVDIPPDMPTGSAEITITITVTGADTNSMNAQEAVAHCRGLAKQLGSRLTSELSLAWRREDGVLEKTRLQRRRGDTAGSNH